MRVITCRSIVKDGKSIFHQHGDIRFGKFTFDVNHGGGGALQSLHNIKGRFRIFQNVGLSANIEFKCRQAGLQK